MQAFKRKKEDVKDILIWYWKNLTETGLLLDGIRCEDSMLCGGSYVEQ